MTFYFAIAALLWLFAWATIFRPVHARWCHYAAVAVFVAVAGLRFETGYDWLAYERYFNGVADPFYCYIGPVMEPLFWALNKLVTLVSSDIQLLFFIIIIINVMVLWRFCRYFQGNFAVAAATIFGWIYLTLYMGTLRQSLAVCMFMLAFMALNRSGRLTSGLLGLAGLGFQVSSFIYLPLLWRAPWQLLLRYIEYFCAACLLYLLLLPSASDIMIYIAETLDLGFISDKLQTYQTLGIRTITAPMIGYLLLNCGFLIYAKHRLVRDATDALLLAPLILMVVFQATLADYPIFWMRIMFFALPCQAVFISRTLQRETSSLRFIYLPIVMVLSFAALAYFGRNPVTIRPYIPYQNIMLKYSGDPVELSSGRERTMKFYQSVDAKLDIATRERLKRQNDAMMERYKAMHDSSCIPLTPSYLPGFFHPDIPHVEKDAK